MAGYRSDEDGYRGEDYSPLGIARGLFRGTELYVLLAVLAVPFVVAREALRRRRAI